MLNIATVFLNLYKIGKLKNFHWKTGFEENFCKPGRSSRDERLKNKPIKVSLAHVSF